MASEAQIARKKAKLEKATAIMRGGVGEPNVTEANYKVDLMLALNWYNANEDNSKLAKYGVEYLKVNKMNDYIKTFNSATDHETRQISILMRLHSRGQFLSHDHKALIEARLATLKAKYSDVKDIKKEDKKDLTPMPSIQDRVLDVARKHAAEINYAIDQFCEEEIDEFNTKAYLLKNNVTGAVSKRIGEMYVGLVEELKEALEGNDEDLNEGYSFMSKSRLKKFLALVEGIVKDCEQQVVTAKAQRAPRAVKVKPPAVVAKNVKYMIEFPELKLKSVAPANIIGADELWTYNTKTRKLTVYKSMSGSGLSVKGTTVINYNVSLSNTVTLRKPEEFFSKTELNKRGMNGAVKLIKTKPSTPNGRISSDMIIVGAFK